MIPRQRSRFRADLKHSIGTYNWAWGFETLPPVQSCTKYQHMIDTVGRASVRPCNSVQWNVVGPPQEYHSFVTEGLPVTVQGLALPVPESAMDNILDLPDESTLQNPMLRAFNSFSTVFPSTFAPVEFVEGLRDWRKLLPTFSGDVNRDISASYLGQKWGRDQLISDIYYLFSLLSTCKSRLEWLRKTYGKPTPIYYSELLTTPSVASWRYNFLPGSWGLRYTLDQCELRFSARATLVHRIPHLNDLTGLYQATVSALGLNNPLKAIWQNLRLSFLVDWIFNVSGLLDRLAQVKPAAEWNIYDVTHSVKLEAFFKIEQDNHYSGTTSDNVFLNYLHLTRYRRSLGLPLVLSDLITSSFSPNQLLALAALLRSTSSR